MYITAINYYELTYLQYTRAGRGNSIGSVSAWHASGPEFDPHVRHFISWRLGHRNISTDILPLPLIQEEQLSVPGERICTKYWKTVKGRIWNLIVSVPDHCLSFYFAYQSSCGCAVWWP